MFFYHLDPTRKVNNTNQKVVNHVEDRYKYNQKPVMI